jgi:hypothetical protein
MKSRYTLFLAGPFVLLTALWAVDPVTALTDGPVRREMEAWGFTETLIKASLYPKSSHDVYSVSKRQPIHGIPRINKEIIYEPDVYTWELAMTAHRQQIAAMMTPSPIDPGVVQPSYAVPSPMLAESPGQVQLTPLDPGQNWRPLPSDATARMQGMLDRARMDGIRPDQQLKAQSIKQRLLDHINSLGGGSSIAAPQPPVLALPRGRAGDSYDQDY